MVVLWFDLAKLEMQKNKMTYAGIGENSNTLAWPFHPNLSLQGWLQSLLKAARFSFSNWRELLVHLRGLSLL